MKISQGFATGRYVYDKRYQGKAKVDQSPCITKTSMHYLN